MPLPVAITLDQLSQRIDTICDDFVKETIESKLNMNNRFDDLTADISASPDLDKDAAMTIVFNRLKRSFAEVTEAIS